MAASPGTESLQDLFVGLVAGPVRMKDGVRLWLRRAMLLASLVVLAGCSGSDAPARSDPVVPQGVAVAATEEPAPPPKPAAAPPGMDVLDQPALVDDAQPRAVAVPLVEDGDDAPPTPPDTPTPESVPDADRASETPTATLTPTETEAPVAPTVRADGFGSCGTRNDLFAHSPVDLADFMGLVPLGNLAPPGHTFPTDHIYFHINRIDMSDWYLGTVEVPVVAPGDVWITAVTFSEALSNDPVITDFSVNFTPCEEVEAFFIHLSGLSERILAEVGTDFDRCDEYSIEGSGSFRNCTKSGLWIKLAAGEEFGSAGGNVYANALDLGVYDLRTPARAFANPDRWTDRSLHIACPLDYFVPEVQADLIGRLGMHDASDPRTAEPICGEVEQDEPGTAQGVWIAKGTVYTYPEDPHLSLVRDNIFPEWSVFSIGNGAGASGLAYGLFYFMPIGSGDVNRAFVDVVPGQVYCYENLTLKFGEPAGLTVLLEMPTVETLRIEGIQGGCGAGPWALSDLATDFER